MPSALMTLSCEADPERPWFCFDAAHYVEQCVEHGISAPLGSEAMLCRHYVERGAAAGLSPNRLFDERYYRGLHPAVGRALQAGEQASGFEHFVVEGAAAGLSPTWFFEGGFYSGRNPDLAAHDLGALGFRDRYAHYLMAGLGERRSSHWTLAAQAMLCAGPAQAMLCAGPAQAMLGAGPAQDMLGAGPAQDTLGAGSARDMVGAVPARDMVGAGSDGWPVDLAGLLGLLADGERLAALLAPAFDYGWMRERYDWGAGVRPAGFMAHYLLHVRSQGLSPSAFFDELFYLADAPEIQAGVDEGVFSSGYQHFVLHGMGEWRRPFAGFDPRYYHDVNMQPGRDPPEAASLAPFVHFLRHRASRRVLLSPPLAALPIAEDAGKGLYERRCAVSAAGLGRLVLPHGRAPDGQAPDDQAPDVSVIIVTRDGFEQVAHCIIGAVAASRARLEVIVFDNGSTDEVRRLGVINPAIRHIRHETNLGFTLAVNHAAALATGRMILLLNNDVELAPGSIDLALARLDAEPDIGVVGGRILRMHGRLQEAGSLVWRDGACHGYGRDRDPLDGQYNVALDVDFCSGCFLAIRRRSWEALGGFDEAFAPAYYEDTDLCLRIWERGERVVYDPRIVVWHFEYGSSRVPEESLTLMRRNQRLFTARHRRFLADCLPAASGNVERARLRHVPGPRLLFIEDMLPEPARGMGFVRSAAILRTLAQCCGLVSVLGLHDTAWPRRTDQDEAGRPVEILSHVNNGNVGAFLRERVGVYDTLWLSRTHNLPRLAGWRALCPEFFAGLRIVLDTEAIAAARRFAYARQAGHAAALPAMVAEELEAVDTVDHILTVNRLDRDLVRTLLDSRDLTIPLGVLGHALALQPRLPHFEATTDITVLGSYAYPDGPNGDALLWFDRAVRPLLPNLPGLRFVVAGAEAARFCRSAGLNHRYHVVDNPPDIAEVFRTTRVMVAPTRFAAGIPMKVHEAASHGVPVAMTELLADQLGWRRPGIHHAPATPEAMAAAVTHLATNRAAWRECQTVQAALVKADCDPTNFETTIQRLVADQHTHDNVVHVLPERIQKRAG